MAGGRAAGSASSEDGEDDAESPTAALDESRHLGQPDLPAVPLQKRRRVTRACDECRRKKIKCDGKQPCTHCTVYSYDCTYDQPSHRRRNPTPQYIEALENRLHRAETLLREVLPSVDLNDPNAVSKTLGGDITAQTTEKASAKVLSPESMTPEEAAEDVLESMVDSAGQLDLDDRGYWDFTGHSSGLVFLRRIKEQFGDMMGESEGQGTHFMKTKPFQPVLDLPRSRHVLSSDCSPEESSLPNIHDLPSRECGQHLCEVALNEACVLMRFVHRPTFFNMLKQIYDLPPEQYRDEENRYLPLIYTVMALGSLFAQDNDSKLPIEGYATAVERGYDSLWWKCADNIRFVFFKAARQMMDIADCRDIPSLQAVMMMILYMQASAKLSTCYSYIGIALHSAIRMGMHRKIEGRFDLIERETRKLIFWQIRKMSIYVAALLGLPMMLCDEDVDQEPPEETDDLFVAADRFLPVPPNEVMLTTATNAHTRLVRILQKVVRFIYPLKGVVAVQNHAAPSYMISHARVREIEKDLQEWMESLPMTLRPGGGKVSMQLLRVQQLLRIAYAYVQIMLYRPFLHYVSGSSLKRSSDKRSYACAAACVNVSRNVVHITTEMNRRGLLTWGHWFVMYTTFFAILSLVFFLLENPKSSITDEILDDAREGKDLLASLAKRSMAADRCDKTLQKLFEQLPQRARGRLQTQQTSQKKRHASTIESFSTKQSAPIVPTINSPVVPIDGRRARTLPDLAAWSTPLTPPPLTSATAVRNPAYHALPPSAASARSSLSGPNSQTTYPNPQPLQRLQTLHQPHQPSSLSTPAITDLSAMMFPSGDPFVYPNQPMTTFENGHATPPSATLAFPSTTSTAAATTEPSARYISHPVFPPNPYDTSLEAQLFGSLPPYLMQGSQAGAAMDPGPIGNDGFTSSGIMAAFEGASDGAAGAGAGAGIGAGAGVGISADAAASAAATAAASVNGAGVSLVAGDMSGDVWPTQSRANTVAASGMDLDAVFGDEWREGWGGGGGLGSAMGPGQWPI